MKTPRHIVLFSGPTGGHLYPALAIAQALKEDDPTLNIDLVTTKRAKSMLEPKVGCLSKVYYLVEFPAPSKFSLDYCLFLIKLSLGFIASFFILLLRKRDLVIGFGSFVAYPGIVLANAFNVPSIIHEQNIEFGKATKKMIPVADFVALSFETEIKDKNKYRITGYPMRSELIKAATERPTVSRPGERVMQVLILGGSQGARVLNEAVLGMFEHFSSEEKKGIAVTHITGRPHLDRVRGRYQSLLMNNTTLAFDSSIQQHYLKADLIISRAGAGTLSEICLFGIPSILIPYPHADRHQYLNAAYYQDKGAALMVEENEEMPGKLTEAFRRLLNSSDERDQMIQSQKALSSGDANARFVKLCREAMCVN